MTASLQNKNTIKNGQKKKKKKSGGRETCLFFLFGLNCVQSLRETVIRIIVLEYNTLI